jgi:Cd2+/Zn2+-exporting ATPase/Cu+-exporting ATPase
MRELQTIEVPVAGMDCSECAAHVQKAICAVPGVAAANVLLAAEKAVIRLDPAQVQLPAIRKAVEGAGYSVPAGGAPVAGPGADGGAGENTGGPALGSAFYRKLFTVFGLLFGAVLFVVVVGEWLGVFEQVTEQVPFVVGLVLVVATGWPIFRNVIRAALRGQVLSHTLMSLGVVAALAVGQWATAAVVVFFMRVGDYAEKLTAEGARRAVKDLAALAPQTARVAREGVEQEVPIGDVAVGEIVVVRPGEKIPVDGAVVGGQATVNQAAITGESMPVEVGPGAEVYAATLAQLGSIRVRVTRVGADTTFGQVVRLVEEAETHRADVQRFADKFSAWYLPIVATIALLTFLLRQDPLATAAVLVVACSCSIALATPIAMLASIGAGAKHGVLIKGGKYLETLARADVVLIDKTGTLTLGQPQITDVVATNGLSEAQVLTLAASAERYSEHPLAEAVRGAARSRGLPLAEPQEFTAIPGMGVRAVVDGQTVTVGNARLLAQFSPGTDPQLRDAAAGKTVLYVAQGTEVVGTLAAADTLRPEVPAALAQLQGLGIRHVELLTGDHEQAAAGLAQSLGVAFRANLLPADKIAIVKEYQGRGHTVVMVGDGVNDAPALAQADVGIAMGRGGADIAVEAAHVTLLREDWSLVPEVLRIAQRTMGVVKLNLGFTAVYNVVGLTLAALGFLPPIFAAAAQSLPDLAMLANSARLIRQQ